MQTTPIRIVLCNNSNWCLHDAKEKKNATDEFNSKWEPSTFRLVPRRSERNWKREKNRNGINKNRDPATAQVSVEMKIKQQKAFCGWNKLKKCVAILWTDWRALWLSCWVYRVADSIFTFLWCMLEEITLDIKACNARLGSLARYLCQH